MADSANWRSNFQQTSHRASLDGPYARRHATPRPEAQEDAAGASGEATPKDSNTPQETLTIEASEPLNPEVNHE
jgi:hypothetical protein